MNLFEMLKNINKDYIKTILVYPRYTKINDPYENTKDEVLLEAVPITDAIVTEIGFGGLKYKYFGQMSIGSKQVLCDKKYLTLLKIAGQIEIDGENYGVYHDADKTMQLLVRTDYIIVLLEKRI